MLQFAGIARCFVHEKRKTRQYRDSVLTYGAKTSELSIYSLGLFLNTSSIILHQVLTESDEAVDLRGRI